MPSVEQMHTATFHSRKRAVASTQIHIEGRQVDTKWARTIGRVEIALRLPGGGGSVGKKTQCGGPRVVCSPPRPQANITQEQLKQLARKHTKPLSLGPKFKPSAAVNTMREMAKQA